MCCIAASLPCCNLYQLPQFPLDTGPLLLYRQCGWVLLVCALHPAVGYTGALYVLLRKDEFIFVYQGAETLLVDAEERAVSDQPRIQIYRTPVVTSSKPSAVLVVSYW